MAPETKLVFKALHPTMAAEVEGVDWSKPLSKSVIDKIKEGIDKYGVLVFRKANLNNQQHIQFSAQFGELEKMPILHRKGRFPSQPEIFDVANLTDEGELIDDKDPIRSLMIKGNDVWHTDLQYHPHRSKYSILRAIEIPPEGCGGETEYADTRTAYEDLSKEMKNKIDGLVACCSLLQNRRTGAPELFKNVDPMDWPITRWKAVYPHEGTGRKNLYLSTYAWKFEGMTREESAPLIEQLLTHATQPKYCHKISWEQPGDMVMWDNTAVIHRAMGASAYIYKYRRDMRRCSVFDGGKYAWGENERLGDWKDTLPPNPLG